MEQALLVFIVLLWLFVMGWLFFVIRPALNKLQDEDVNILVSLTETNSNINQVAQQLEVREPQPKELSEEEKSALEMQKRLQKMINAKLASNPYERNRNRRNHG